MPSLQGWNRAQARAVDVARNLIDRGYRVEGSGKDWRVVHHPELMI